mmetsp:Transcript_96964/g.159667  ORF Transcript_96964/g.159667 Transcript_96964/m.159667 type:complete len:252 (-) Transcript_96964:46-801(-)
MLRSQVVGPFANSDKSSRHFFDHLHTSHWHGRVDAGQRLEVGSGSKAITRSSSFSVHHLPGVPRDERDWVVVKRRSNMTKSTKGYLEEPRYLWKPPPDQVIRQKKRSASLGVLSPAQLAALAPASGVLICFLYHCQTWRAQMRQAIKEFKAKRENIEATIHAYDDYGDEITILDAEGFPNDQKIEDWGVIKWPVKVYGDRPEGPGPPDDASLSLRSALKADIDSFLDWVGTQESVLTKEAEELARSNQRRR